MKAQAYVAPAWAAGLAGVPSTRVPLVRAPTPVERVEFSVAGESYSLLVKRDDLTGAGALSGNKLRKLEFLFARLQEGGHDAAVSCGGTQSNSCRAVSAVAAQLHVPCFHVLRKDPYYREELRGNRLLMNVLGTRTFLVSKEEYARGQEALLRDCARKLVDSGLAESPYVIPVGASCYESVFGYIECVREIEEAVAQGAMEKPSSIFFSSGSGGTAAGLALGIHLSSLRGTPLVGYIACDSPAYFYEHVQQMLDQTGLTLKAEELVTFKAHAKGRAYGVTSEEEVAFVREVARTSGLLLDPTYTGKAMRGWVTDPQVKHAEARNALFIHTGGLSSLDSVSHMLGDESLIESLY